MSIENNQVQVNKKLPKKAIIFGFLVIIGLVGSAYLYQQSKQNKITVDYGTVLTDKNRNLSEESKKIYNERVRKGAEVLKNLQPNQTDYKIQKVNSYVYLGQQYFGLGQLEDSKKSYIQALLVDPTNEAALTGLAYTYTDAGEYALAEVQVRKAIGNTARNYNLWLQLVDIKKSQGVGEDDLEKIFEEALKATNRYIDILTKYAQFEESRLNIPKAISLWQEAAKSYPDNANIYNAEITRLKSLSK